MYQVGLRELRESHGCTWIRAQFHEVVQSVYLTKRWRDVIPCISLIILTPPLVPCTLRWLWHRPVRCAAVDQHLPDFGRLGKSMCPNNYQPQQFLCHVCVCKHLGALCWLFRTRLDENNDDRSFFDSWHFSLSGFEVSGIRESSRFRYYHFAGGQWISFHPLPNEDGGLRLWYLRGTPWRRTCKFELFELLTSCYNTVFPSKFRLQSDRFPTNFRHMSVWCPSNFRSFPLVSGRTFDQFPISFELHFDELWQLGLRLLPDDRLFRKKILFVLIEAYETTFLFLELHQTNM